MSVLIFLIIVAVIALFIFINVKIGDLKYRAKQHILKNSGIRYDEIIYGLPCGERILVNDCKPSGVVTAIAINKKRDSIVDIEWIIDKDK